MTLRHSIPVLALAFLVFLPEALSACPVCFDPNDENRRAFITTAIFLTLMPFGILGGAGWWLRRRFRQLSSNAELRGKPEEHDRPGE